MFMRIDRRFMAKCFGQMQELGIYPGQIPVLGLLAHKDGLSQREIAEKLHIKPPTVNVTVQRLEKAGFLYREADEKDQRISRIYLTEKGKQTKESGMKKVQDNEKILLDGFSEEDLCLLRRFLDQITENIEKYRLHPVRTTPGKRGSKSDQTDEISEKISWLCSTDHSTSVSSGLLRSVTAGLHIQDRQCGNPAKWYRRQCT